jgi:hypothetical protein
MHWGVVRERLALEQWEKVATGSAAHYHYLVERQDSAYSLVEGYQEHFAYCWVSLVDWQEG